MGAAPLFLLVWSLGLVDGLTQRTIRRACAGRESSSMYHRAKFFQFAGLATGAMVYLMWPVSIRPEWIVLPLALLTGAVVAGAVDVSEEVPVRSYERVKSREL
jgi:integrating conjugative element membrane protein (TIGR03747 family)